MGRTQRTYRMRLQEIRDRMLRLVKDKRFVKQYRELWVAAHSLSAPASTFPWPDTNTVATYCFLIDALKQLNELEEKFNQIEIL